VDTNAQLGKRPIGFASGQAAADILGFTPRWQFVDAALFADAPWSGICAVYATEGGRSTFAGTGWLAGPATVVTAAHVIAGAARGNGDAGFAVRFPGEVAAVAVLDALYHPDYQGRPGDLFDPFDVGVLRIADGGRAPLAIDGRLAPSSVDVPGYPAAAEGRLVVDGRDAVPRPHGLVLHGADTAVGHSGAPVLASAAPGQARSVVALHIQGYAGNPDAVSFPQHNLALAIVDAIADFIDAHRRSA